MSSFFLAYSLRSRLNSDLNWLSNFLRWPSLPMFYPAAILEGDQSFIWDCLYEDPNLVPHTYIVGVASLRVLPRCSKFPLANFFFLLYYIIFFFLLSSDFFWIRLSFPLCDNHHLSSLDFLYIL